jgi:PEP-CTERM motif-containing protein
MNFTWFKVAAVIAAGVSHGLAAAATPTLIMAKPNYVHLDFSQDTVILLNSMRSNVAAYEGGLVNISTRPGREDSYSTVSATLPIKDFTYELVESSPMVALSSARTTGGFQITTADDGFMSVGGHLEISNLRLDAVSKAVLGWVSGAHGLTGRELALWNVDSFNVDRFDVVYPLPAPITPPPQAVTAFDARLSGLTLTQDGFGAFQQGLGLTKAGTDALTIVSFNGFGDITTSAVPEPGSYVLFILGLTGLGALARRRA